MSTPVVDLAVKQVVQRAPGSYAAVNHHPSTIVALRDLYREVRAAGPGTSTALAGTARGAEPARVAAEVAALLATDWYDEGDLLARATERARRRRARSPGPPRRPPSPAAAPARARAAHRPRRARRRRGDRRHHRRRRRRCRRRRPRRVARRRPAHCRPTGRRRAAGAAGHRRVDDRRR